MKISEESKRLLEKMQAKLFLATGRKVSQQELIDNLVKFTSEREDELNGPFTGVKLPLSPKDIENLMGLPKDWGIKTREREIDTILHGLKSEKRP